MTDRRSSRSSRLLFALPLLFAVEAGAQEFRSIQGIPTPPPPKTQDTGEAWLAPPDRATVEAAVDGLFAAWNTPALRSLLSREFYEQTRLPETLSVEVPRDAKIRILALESWSMIGQKSEPGPGEWTITVTNTVSVVVRSQIEFNDAGSGYVRLEGVNEYVFDITEVIPR